MTYAELIQLYFERSNALQWYWTLYVVIVGGLLAFSSIRRQPDRLTTLLVSVLFCLFAYENLDAIHDVTVQRYATLDAIRHLSAAGPLEPTLLPPAFKEVRTVHLTGDVLTVAAVWAMELRRKRATAAEQRIN